jgi:hypothetical protein
LLVTGIAADHPDAATTSDDSTFLTHFLGGRPYLHHLLQNSKWPVA